MLFKILLGLCATLLIVNAGLLAFGLDTYRAIRNAQAGCYPWSPKEVPYSEGMTICPGQWVRVTVPLNSLGFKVTPP